MSEYRVGERERAIAFALFCGYTDLYGNPNVHGALYVLRGRPDVAEIAVKRVAGEGVEEMERFLAGVSG